jgi:hypothetical protein
MKEPHLNNSVEVPDGMEQCLKEMQEIETKFNAMMQDIVKNIDQEVKAYARLTSDISGYASIFAKASGHSGAADAIARGTTIIQKGLEIAGRIKSDAERNRMLDKLLYAKKEMAKVHKMGIERLLPRAERNEERLRELALTMLNKDYELTSYNPHFFNLAEENCMKCLQMYRTSKYLVSMGYFVQAEIAAWERGRQTSGAARPTLYTVNLTLLKELFGPNPLSAFDKAAHATDMKGTQMVMLRDEMLLPCVIDSFDGMMGIDLSACSVQAKKLLKENKSIHLYMKSLRRLTKAGHANPLLIGRILALMMLAVWCVFIWMFTQSGGTETSKFLTFLIMLIGSGAIFAYYKNREAKIVVRYFENIHALADRMKVENLQRAGYQEFQKIDYAKKSLPQAALEAI